MGVDTPMIRLPPEAAGQSAGLEAVRSAGAILAPQDVAEVVVQGLAEERFLILPHPEVLEFFRRKASDYDRWLAGIAACAGPRSHPREGILSPAGRRGSEFVMVRSGSARRVVSLGGAASYRLLPATWPSPSVEVVAVPSMISARARKWNGSCLAFRGEMHPPVVVRRTAGPEPGEAD